MYYPDAECLYADPEIFFPPKGDPAANQAAKRICNRCSCKEQCLEDHFDEPYGIYGGTSHKERTAMRSKGDNNEQLGI